jgi:citrate lyase subunit beta/citryl-CoA lyase
MSYEPSEEPLDLIFQSKLETLFGDSTRELLLGLCHGAGVNTGSLTVEDTGAYPFVLRARLESLLRLALSDNSLELPPECNVTGEGVQESRPVRELPRRSRLYLPGNESKYMLNAAIHQPDGVILDLEDSVSPTAKHDARSLIRHALWSLDFGSCERMVRINQGEEGLKDIQALGDAPFELILIPKVETAEEVVAVAQAAPGKLLMPILESAAGVQNSPAIAAAHESIVALTLGLEDLTADLGVVKTPKGMETLFARSFVVQSAKAQGLQAIDSVYGDVADEIGLRASIQEAKALGFEGKGCVHPRQIRVVHEEFAPSEKELDKARKIVAAFEAAEAQGLGVVSLGSKMIDPPVVKRALNLVRQAEKDS